MLHSHIQEVKDLTDRPHIDLYTVAKLAEAVPHTKISKKGNLKCLFCSSQSVVFNHETFFTAVNLMFVTGNILGLLGCSTSRRAHSSPCHYRMVVRYPMVVTHIVHAQTQTVYGRRLNGNIWGCLNAYCGYI